MKTQKTMLKKTMTINTKTKTVTAMAMKTWGVVTQQRDREQVETEKIHKG